MNKLKEKNGITLIALVITIIVLLILAGVAIATLTGDNGILTQSQKAKYVNIYKGAEEQVNLATMAVKAEIAGQKAKSGTYSATDTESINALKAIVATDLVSEGSGFEVEEPKNGEIAGTKLIRIRYSNTALKASGISDGVPAQTGHVNYIITVTAGDATLETDIADGTFGTFTAGTGNSGNGGNTSASPTAEFGDANTTYKDYFGKIVIGYNPTSGSNWRLFYADDNYAYLICDRIGNTTYALNNTSVVKGWETSTIGTLAQNFNKKYTTTGNWELKTDGTNLNNNIKAVAALMDTSKWTDYVEDGIAEWATGAPTVEMFIKSYNATHSSLTLYSNVESNTATGYQVSTDNSTWVNGVSGLGKTSDLDKAIYCNGTYHYWLASPSAFSSDYVMLVGRNGYLTSNYYNDANYCGLRPLVSVPLSEIGLPSEDKTIAIQNYYFMSTVD